MKLMTIAAAAAAAATLGPTGASAQECVFEQDIYDLDEAGMAQLYDCIDDALVEAYGREGDAVGSVYRDWQVTSTGAFVPGVHGDRALITYANDIAFDDYVQYRDEGDFSMPVGSVLAKESFSIRDNGEPRVGPLFIMTKVAEGEADEFGNWVYSAVRANGAPMGISQNFCHDCHVAYDFQDNMGYPAFEVRLGAE